VQFYINFFFNIKEDDKILPNTEKLHKFFDEKNTRAYGVITSRYLQRDELSCDISTIVSRLYCDAIYCFYIIL